VEYWPHRIETIKSMGLNALSVYVFWNYHEISKGVFDFETENKNLTHFLELAKKYDMDVLLRPGPYVCAEWDFGGLPPRFLDIEGMKIR
jgi:beta-galactosidase